MLKYINPRKSFDTLLEVKILKWKRSKMNKKVYFSCREFKKEYIAHITSLIF